MALILAAAVTALVTPVVAWIAIRLDIVDRPGELKIQEAPVAYLGGIAIAAGLAGPLATSQPAFLLPLGLSLGLGLTDDVFDVPPTWRVAAEVGIGGAAFWALPGDPHLATAPLLAFVLVVLLNAVNLLDGMDALAGSVTLAGALGFAVVLTGDERTVALALGGALAGFLLWNRPPARIYAGDAGSYLVGATLTLLLALTVLDADDGSVAFGAVLFVAVPVADTAVAIVRRRRAGRLLLQGDRGHVYDQLVDRGHDPRAVVFVFAGAQAVLVVAGLGLGLLDDVAAAVGLVLLTVVVGALAFRTFTAPSTWVHE